MQVYQDEVMQVAGFMVRVSDFEDGQERSWHYGMFDTYDDAQAFRHAYPDSMISPIYKPATH